MNRDLFNLNLIVQALKEKETLEVDHHWEMGQKASRDQTCIYTEIKIRRNMLLSTLKLSLCRPGPSTAHIQRVGEQTTLAHRHPKTC